MKEKKVTLTKPIKRGDKKITDITVLKPNVLSLKGLKLLDVMQFDVNALTVLLPRVTKPMLTKADIEQLEIADFTKLSTELAGFFGAENEDGEEGKDEATLNA
ncbi:MULTISPECIES: phage tail assembly protein [Pasteurellaceae]|uniref:Phage tail assembly protein n=1 Tax=Pasteurella atlantica TaxID=2827233 RepID=A0AAW8CG67_9PAST|nr:phage tail assembly protein [Pasteurella atlantica]MBR0573361.1 phage tail assembly protein [Pasteurella atlantica]MDP8039831.1 phage tail assembly protein [Pasteurella atlantica]MDP8041848.1 phage tail assembly protein [Pasteurella atlantica]MDP8043915.1 phage tail assembly protein [Pasteurella atlantica]MDP8046081.1 phage tail assembly protein [Pasteurella atlantica]